MYCSYIANYIARKCQSGVEWQERCFDIQWTIYLFIYLLLLQLRDSIQGITGQWGYVQP